jgi:hypothetical protein
VPTRLTLETLFRLDPMLKSTDVVSDADMRTLMNLGAVDLAKKAWAFPQKAQWDTVASTSEYVLGGASPKVTGFLELWEEAGGLVYRSSSTDNSRGVLHLLRSESWLDREYPGWQTANASDTLQFWCLSIQETTGYLVLKTYPKASTVITDAFTLYCLARGTDMSADGHYPWTGSTVNLEHTEPYQMAIVYYAQWWAHTHRTQMESAATRALEKYVALAAEFKQSQTRLFLPNAGLRAQAMIDSQWTLEG